MKEMIYQSTPKRELLYSGEYMGYKFYIMNLGTHPTAYIKIPAGHKLFDEHYSQIDIDVHGGLTYAADHLSISDKEELKGWFIGWDYAHSYDYAGYYEEYYDTEELKRYAKDCKKWTTKEIVEECKSAIEKINDIKMNEQEKDEEIKKLNMIIEIKTNRIQDLLGRLAKRNEKIESLEKNYNRIYNEDCKLREQRNITDASLLDENYRLSSIIDELKKWLKSHLDDEYYWVKVYAKVIELEDKYANR